MCDVQSASIGALNYSQNLLAGKSSSDQAYYQQMQQWQAANANWDINKKQADDAYRMRLANAVLQMQQIQVAQQEVNESAAEEKAEIAREMMRARAAAELSAGEAGISGNSVDRMLADLGFTEQSKLAAVESSRENQISQLQMEKHNVKQSSKSSPIYAAIGAEPSKSGGWSSYLSAAVSGLATGVGAGYKPRTSTKTSEVSSATASRKPKLR